MCHDKAGLGDEQLVLKARTGDVGAFEELVRRHFRIIYAIAYARTKHRQTAEDLSQEVFLRTFLHLDTVNDPSRFSAWLATVTRNLAFKWAKRQRRTSSLVARVMPEAMRLELHTQQSLMEARRQMERTEGAQALRNAIFQLPATQAEMILLRFGEDMKPPEIAERLGVHPTTVRRRLKDALGAMKQSIAEVMTEVAPTLMGAKESAIRTVRLLNAVAVLSPQDAEALHRLSASSYEKGVWMTGMPLRSFYYWAYRTTPGRIIMPPDFEDRHFDMTVETSQAEYEALYPAMQKLLADETGLAARWELRTVDVSVLTKTEPLPAALRQPGELPNGWYSFMRLDSSEGSECQNAKIHDLVIHLEENLRQPVIDETEIDKCYDWDIAWPKGAMAEEIVEAMRVAGFALKPSRRNVEMLVLEKEKD